MTGIANSKFVLKYNAADPVHLKNNLGFSLLIQKIKDKRESTQQQRKGEKSHYW